MVWRRVWHLVHHIAPHIAHHLEQEVKPTPRIGIVAGAFVLTAVLAAAVIDVPNSSLHAQDFRRADRRTSDENTPQSIDALIQEGAEAQRARGGLSARTALYTVVWPKDAGERDDLAQNTIVLVTVVTQKEEELPLRRVYLVTPDGHATDLRAIGTWQSGINPKSLAYTKLGKFRQDAFYLIAGAATQRDGEVRLDFAVNRTGFVLMRLPVIKLELGFAFGEPPPDAQPKNEAVKALIERRFPGFPVPTL
jgi:hypothetical protein